MSDPSWSNLQEIEPENPGEWMDGPEGGTWEWEGVPDPQDEMSFIGKRKKKRV